MLENFILVGNIIINRNMISSITITPVMPLEIPYDLKHARDVNGKVPEQKTAFVVDVTILTEAGEYTNNVLRFFNDDAKRILIAIGASPDPQSYNPTPAKDYYQLTEDAYREDMARLKRGEFQISQPAPGADDMPW